MQELIERAIIRKSRSLLRKQRIENSQAVEHAQRYEVRTGRIAGPVSSSDPAIWQLHPHFDPRYCIAHARYLSRVIWRKLQVDTYQTTPAVQFDVPKPDGSHRQVMAFTIPDAAVSNVMHRALTRKNLNIFSSYSFAYRPDRGVFDAVLHLRRSLGGHKSYIIQYDFSSYFDTIDHSFLLRLLFSRRVFLISDAEGKAIAAFLKHRFAAYADYSAGDFSQKSRGVPQGSSISLFLSNAAAHDLDLLLEAQNGVFTRFADDVVAITRSYSDAISVANAFREHCRDAGLQINYRKSPGIQLFVGAPDRERRDFVIDRDDGVEIENIEHIDYVGHRIVPSDIPGFPHVVLPDKAIVRIKRRISSIAYIHLFQHRRGPTGLMNSARLGPGFVDWDLVTCINEIRSYIYGGLSEAEVTSFLTGNVRLSHVRGLMGLMPLISRVDRLRELDGWLVSMIRRAQRERVRVAAARGLTLTTLSEASLISGYWYSFGAVPVETRLPSFVRAWRASKKFYRKYGLDRVSATPPYSAVSAYTAFGAAGGP